MISINIYIVSILLILNLSNSLLSSSYKHISILNQKRFTSITHRHVLRGSKREESINEMTVDEIKAELDLRNVNYDDCLQKSQLVSRLAQSRATGRADPNIIEQFKDNQDKFSALDNPEILDEMKSSAGTLPGGLPPEVIKAMIADPELMQLLKDPKMQSVLKSVMEKGPDGIKPYLADPDAILILQQLSKVMSRVQK